METKEIIDKLQTIVRNAGKSSIVDKYHIENLIMDIELRRVEKKR